MILIHFCREAIRFAREEEETAFDFGAGHVSPFCFVYMLWLSARSLWPDRKQLRVFWDNVSYLDYFYKK